MLCFKKVFICLFMFQRCLICTDFTDGLHRLTEYIPNLAQSGLQQIVFFHSVPFSQQGKVPREDSEAIKKAQMKLSGALTDVPSQVQVAVEVASGEPTETITRVLQNYQIDVIILGTPIRSSWQEKIFGNTSMAIAKLTPIPLLILRPQLISTYTTEELALRCAHLWRYLLIPYNDGEAARYLVERIKEYVRNCPDTSLQKCMLIWVVEDGGRNQELTDFQLEQARQKLQPVKAELEAFNLEVNWEVRHAEPITEILSAALTFDISAIALANDYSTNLLKWTVPSFANELLHRSWFPLLFFSPKR
jgi:nucleotide-binding universal stress UspA family protein